MSRHYSVRLQTLLFLSLFSAGLARAQRTVMPPQSNPATGQTNDAAAMKQRALQLLRKNLPAMPSGDRLLIIGQYGVGFDRVSHTAPFGRRGTSG